MRLLITGAAGFVGQHVIVACRELVRDATILATSKNDQASPDRPTTPPATGMQPLDVTDEVAVEKIVSDFQPTHVLHLAAVSAISRAAAASDKAWHINVTGTRVVARVLARSPIKPVLINAGSGLAYGSTANITLLLTEESLLAPGDTYGATKAAADLTLGAMLSEGLRCIRMRPFNHTGAGQSTEFVAPAFAMQIAQIEASDVDPVIRVGNLDTVRDFTDVRDVARAYIMAALSADKLPNGAVINIASGIGTRTGDILERLLRLTPKTIRVEQDPARMRPSDVPRMIGNAARAKALLNWQPELSLDETLLAVLNDCRARVRS